jgi:UDP-N-acetylmuramyl-tripeptide synthetase
MGKNPCAVINEEDAHGRRLLVEMKPKSARVLSYSIANQAIQIGLSGLKGTFDGIEFESKLVGSFNASNILAAISVGRGLGLSDEVISRGIQNLESVPGRLERIPNSLGINALVDYAHKPDALEKVLKTLKSAKGKNRLITIFGCGGDRDRLKRPLMGRIAVENSDCVVITSDNPRTEDPAQIIEEILKGIPEGSGNFEVVPDRRGAIFRGIDLAAPGDVVVVAGKGHEDYQIIKTPQGTPQKIEFDDRKVTAEALAFKTQSI